MFGNDNPMPAPPPLPPPLPATPQFASGAGRPTSRGRPYGGTLLTNPMGGGSNAPTARPSLVTA
jgi:hypothetical protein